MKNTKPRGERERTRSLQQFEASTEIVRTDPGDPPIDYYSPFGPLIARLRMPGPLVARLNDEVERVAALHEVPGGETLGTFKLSEEFSSAAGRDSLAGFVADAVARYQLQTTGRELRHIRFERFWAVRHFDGSFSPAHFHSGDISGVGYLRVPDHISQQEAQEERTYVSARRAGYLTFLLGGAQPHSKTVVSFKPEVGDFFVFPGWLLHAAEPFHGKGERRSFAFNAHVG